MGNYSKTITLKSQVSVLSHDSETLSQAQRKVTEVFDNIYSKQIEGKGMLDEDRNDFEASF